MADDAQFSAEDALDRLYAARPEDFTAQRTRLAAEAKRGGAAAAAKKISGSRKPTAAAWVVNLLALRGTARASLSDLGARLREAHAAMDGEAIRTLTGEQRRLVDELSRAGFLAAGIDTPSAALRDDVTATLQAAVADPDVAARLGRLTKAEQWSGFGEFGTATAVSAKRTPPVRAAPVTAADKKAARKPDDEQARKARAALAAAEHRKSEADAALTELQSDLARARLRVTDARRRLADAEQALTAAEDAYAAGKRASSDATAAVKAAKSAPARVQQPRASLGTGIGEGETRT